MLQNSFTPKKSLNGCFKSNCPMMVGKLDVNIKTKRLSRIKGVLGFLDHQRGDQSFADFAKGVRLKKFRNYWFKTILFVAYPKQYLL